MQPTLNDMKLELLLSILTSREHIGISDEGNTNIEVISCQFWNGPGSCEKCPFEAVGKCLLNFIASKSTNVDMIKTLIKEIKYTAATKELAGQFHAAYKDPNKEEQSKFTKEKCIKSFRRIVKELSEEYLNPQSEPEPSADRFSNIELVNDYE